MLSTLIRPCQPDFFHEESTSLRLYDIERRVEVPFEGLSSGEKVILSTVIWNYAAQQGARHPKLLLLDEPDAHLHPSLVRRFLTMIQEVFIRQRGIADNLDHSLPFHGSSYA